MKINMPGCYIQESGAISKIPVYFNVLRENNSLILMDEFTFNNMKEKVVKGFEEYKCHYIVKMFKGECCLENIKPLVEEINNNNIKFVIGIGGGKALDVAKAVGYFSSIKSIMVPTAASTDGPCSKISVLYESDGTFKEYIYLNNNPNGVIVDTEVIANAPVRLIKAGIGDALSTYFETEAGCKNEIAAIGYTTVSSTARALSKTCYENIMTYALEAVKAVENKTVNKALEKTVESIIYLSCVGFENGYLAAAHSIANALTSTPKYNKFMHGEKVAFGTVVQMLLEVREWDEVQIVVNLCRELDLPYNMSQIGIENEEDLEYLANKICEKDQPIHNMKKVLVSKSSIISAMKFTERLNTR